ncbi:MAG: alpha/beta hydrolase [Elainella sp. Prado103]|jgi:predicted dienelactone hydrolase|nr:alpha/beta hydrolase [Elainella sp. Prado103]
MFDWQPFFRSFLLALLLTLLFAQPNLAAQRIYLSYGILGRSLTLTQLEQFAETGVATGILSDILNRFSPEQQTAVRSALQSHYPVNPVMIDRFAYTSSGERLLQEAGQILQSAARLNGFKGIRSAAILAADQPEGMSLLGFLRQFPTDLRIDLQQLLQLIQRVSTILQQTRQIVASLNQQTLATAQSAHRSIDFSHQPDLRRPGSFAYHKQTIQFQDTERQRQFAADVYLPHTNSLLDPNHTKIPVIIGSNGLGAGRDRFEEIAPHLASHGFAVIVPDHPGSDRQRLREFYAGLHPENFDATEYLDRPLDIRFVLDDLEHRNAREFGDRLNLQQVGLFGYSFGGTTALSLAGAQFDFEFLASDCQTEMGLVNISLLYQCRALELPREPVNLKDDRIKAAFIFVPFGKSLFGQTGMKTVDIPIFWQVTDLDVLTPLAVEQIPAFQALTQPDRYLAITEGLPHARVTYDILNRFTGSTTPWETLKWIAQDYQNALSLAFFQVYLWQDQTYRDYLTPNYALAITQDSYRLSLVRSIEETSQK